jgi:thiamine pyrophosphate-dependent acetolactate synthase large subunit-like protein
MAAGMGGDGVRVHTRAELKAALDRAMATRGRFQLIDIPSRAACCRRRCSALWPG